MLGRAGRLDAVADAIGQVEVDCAVALGTFGAGRLDVTERMLRQARERLTRAIVTVKRRGGHGVR